MEILIIGIIVASIYFGMKKRRQKINQVEMSKERILEWLKREKGISNETIQRLQDMELQQIQFALMHQNMLNEQEMHRMMNEMNDPYLNPGLDAVVDSHYHGIDNGLEPNQNHQSNDFHNNDNNNNGSNGGGFNNGF